MDATLLEAEPRAASGRKPMTVDEFYEFGLLPENRNKTYELVRGEVVEMSQPRRYHGAIVSRINGWFERHIEDTQFGYATATTGVVVERDPDSVRGPDLCYWNDVKHASDFPSKWGETVPLIAVEVLSPNDRKRDVSDKICQYLACGVGEVWIVEHERRTITVHSADDQPKAYLLGDVLVSNAVPGLTMSVDRAFRFANGDLIPLDE